MRASKTTVKTLSQVFMADIHEPTTDDIKQDDDPSSRRDNRSNSKDSDPDNTSPVTITLGEPGTLPKKTYKGTEHINHRSGKPESSKPQTPGMEKEDHHIEKIHLSNEALARIKDAVKRGKLL